MVEEKGFARRNSALRKPDWNLGAPSTETVPARSLYAVASRVPAQPLVVRGFANVAAYKTILKDLARLTGQTGAMDDLDYFMGSWPALNKIPCLVLQQAAPGAASIRGFAAATLLFEYKTPFGGTGVFTTTDPSGRRNLLAPRELRPQVAAEAARTLMDRGAQIVHIAFHQLPEDIASAAAIQDEVAGAARGQSRTEWCVSESLQPLYLPLADSFDATLARIGRKSRSNLRYYRRRTQRELGCVFFPRVQMGLEDFLTLNRECTYGITDDLARERYQSMSRIADPLFCGIQDRDGRWLSLVGGRRREEEVEIDWQMNRAGLPLYSLSTVARSCLIEDEISRGTQRLYFELGTPHPIRFSFLEGRAVELTVKRTSAFTWGLARLPWKPFQQTQVSRLLRRKGLVWHPW